MDLDQATLRARARSERAAIRDRSRLVLSQVAGCPDSDLARFVRVYAAGVLEHLEVCAAADRLGPTRAPCPVWLGDRFTFPSGSLQACGACHGTGRTRGGGCP